MITKSTSTSTSRRGCEKRRAEERRWLARVGASRAFLQVAEEARELDEHDERDEHAEGVTRALSSTL